jgi:FkbM family methyltransferase
MNTTPPIRMQSRRPFFRLARVIYRATPFRPLRQAGFSVYTRLVRNRVVREDIDGAQYELHLSEMIDLALYLQQFEPDVRAAIRRVTRPGMTILDIGANIGAHTLLFSSLAGPAGRVVAFEPTDFAFAKLQKNISLNPHLHVDLVRLALSDRAAADEQVDFRASWQTNGSRVNGISTVNVVRLDDWAEANRLSAIDVIKLDVDGYEYRVISGGERTIARTRPVFIIEASGLHFAEPSRNPFEVLRRLGYELWDLSEAETLTFDAVRGRLSEKDPAFSVNLIAKPA